MAEINVPGLAGLIVFYFLILFAGIFSKKILRIFNKGGSKKDEEGEGKVLSSTDDMMLAGRDINYFVGIFTMTATWVGGGYINGAAEATIKKGVLWCQAPFCYAISLFCGGLFFAKKMRKMNFVTMLDPFQEKYGKIIGAFFYIPAFSGEILWSAAILSALGTSLQVICGIPEESSIIASAGFAMFYTLFGGLYSVAFTDIFQLICIFVGLILGIPFMTTNTHVHQPLKASVLFDGKEHSLLGSIAPSDAAMWVDAAIMMMCGGIPWQAYFQRVLSSRTPDVAKVLSMCAAIGCFSAAIPAVIIGWIAMNTDWVAVGFTQIIDGDEYKLAVPACLNYLCPPAVTFIGLGAVSAAVMSSTDSSILGVSCMFTRNVFRTVFMPQASDRVMKWALRAIIVVNTSIAMIIAITVKSVYGLYLICSDLVFILLFPHLVLVVHFPKYANKYGMIVGFSMAFLLRALSGEPVLKYDAVLKFPYYQEGVGDEIGYQRFPYRIFLMLLHLGLVIAVTLLTEFLHREGYVTEEWDVLGVFTEREKESDLVIQNTSCQANGKASEASPPAETNGEKVENDSGAAVSAI